MKIKLKFAKFFIAFKIMKCISLICLACMVIWVFSDYDFSKWFLNGFPMLCVPIQSTFESKKISNLILPLIISIALWIPIKKSYSFLYGVISVEKWKALIIAVSSAIFFCVVTFLSPNNAKQYLWSLSFSSGYFILLHYCIKEMKKEEFFRHYDVAEKSKNIKRKIISAGLVYLLIIVSSVIEYNYDIERFRAQLPLQASSIYNSKNGYVTDISSDKKKLILNNVEGSDLKIEQEIKIDIYDKETDSKKRLVDKENIYYGQYGVDDNCIIAQGIDDKSKDGWLIYYNSSGEIIQEFPRLNELNHKVHKINYTKDKKYFATIGRVVTIWNSGQKQLLKIYDDLKYEKKFVWLNEKNYIVIQKKYSSQFSNEDEWIVEEGHIAENGHIETARKKRIESFLKDKTGKIYKLNFLVNTVKDKEEIAITVSGIPLNGILSYESDVMFFDLESENVDFLLNRSYKVIQLEIFSDKNQLITLEEMNFDEHIGERTKVIFWNMKTKKKEKTLIIGGLQNNLDAEKIKIAQDGSQIMEFTESLKLWNIN